MVDIKMKPVDRWSCLFVRLRAALATAVVLSAVGFVPGGAGHAAEIKDAPRWTKGSDFSSLKDWSLKAEQIVPHGVNPLYYPITPGHKHALERPDHPDGKYRKETVVLNTTEDFDIRGIGKFKTSVVQDEEYLDGVLTQRTLNWLALDKATNNVHSFGEVSWKITDGKPSFTGTWRAGDPDGDGVAEPGLLMPGTFKVGERYIFAGSRSTAYGGAENMEDGLQITVPAGTFKGCVRVREQGLIDLKDISDKVWCPEVGIVSDTSDGKLVISNALPSSNQASNVSSIGKLRDRPGKQKAAAATKITAEEAKKIALQRVSGKVTDVTIERKKGKNVYVVEIQTGSSEVDVLVDTETGKILGTE
ncbi:PepSY domain-containing protein [Bradyrhizobium manausense]|nr:PepSY domain-containing protein [Bradyrhizobium manausense]UVO33334.1 PepSY domain-containing protein [Bradyrhizobium arachidis]